jgi:hypothetical protein
MRHIALAGLVCAALIFALASSASAQPKTDTFNGIISMDGSVQGGGTGWDGGRWVEYPNTGWWNQWFYDDPPDFNRWKEIYYDIQLMKELPDAVDVEVAINWSSMLYPESGPGGPPPVPPLTPLEEQDFIVREIIFSGPVTEMGETLEGDLLIPDYNPEWVSIDVRLLSMDPPDQVWISGTIIHECIPEPMTLGVLSLGALLAIRRKRR